MKEFQRPKAYDPALADRPLNGSVVTTKRTSSRGVSPEQKIDQSGPSRARQLHQDLGFEDEPNFIAEERVRELEAEVADMQAIAAAARETEALLNKKLSTLQQVSRSQAALMKAELQKTRRMLKHREALVEPLQKQVAWMQQQSPALRPPAELRHLPAEEDFREEAEELAKLHSKWEKDVLQLEKDILASAGGATGSQSAGMQLTATPALPVAAAENGSAAESAAKKRCGDLEAALRKLKKDFDKQKAELESLKASGSGSALAPGPKLPAPPPEDTEAVAAVRQELEAREKEAKDSGAKLKKLATMYKTLQGDKDELQKKFEAVTKGLQAAEAEAAMPREPERKPLSGKVVASVHGSLALQRQQLKALRSSVAADLQTLPATLEEVLEQLRPLLQEQLTKRTEAAAQEWKDKWQVECDKRRKLHNLVQELKGNIRVYCRVRPLNERESGSCISFPAPSEIRLDDKDHARKMVYVFNQVFEESTTQEQVFDEVKELITSMMDGFQVCIFAYGQTGSGKTHSMQGTAANPGIYRRTFNELFKVAAQRVGWTVELRGAIVEIYLEEIRDLLNDAKSKPKLTVKQSRGGGNEVPGLVTRVVTSPEEVEELLNQGQKNRSTAATDMNMHSSRSHLMVQIYGSFTTDKGKVINSCITLVDLAGSERLKQSNVTGDRQKEAIFINKSLSALGDVINARAQKQAHVPYRNSALTSVLQDSLSGDSKTLMLLQINPCQDYVEESLSSLKFGERVNNVELKK